MVICLGLVVIVYKGACGGCLPGPGGGGLPGGWWWWCDWRMVVMVCLGAGGGGDRGMLKQHNF